MTTATTTAKGTNYRAKRQFGSYPRGTVFPRWRLAFAGNVDEMVKSGMVEPTTDPVVLKFEVPETEAVPKEAVPDADVQKALNASEEAHETLKTENAALRAKVAELEKAAMGRLIEWGKATDLHAAEREADAAAVRAAVEAEAAVRAELAATYDRIADLEATLAAVEKAAEAQKTADAAKAPKKPKAKPEKPEDAAPPAV